MKNWNYFILIILFKNLIGLCNLDLLNKFGIYGLKQPSRTIKNFVCTNIKYNCCSYIDQLALFKIEQKTKGNNNNIKELNETELQDIRKFVDDFYRYFQKAKHIVDKKRRRKKKHGFFTRLFRFFKSLFKRKKKRKTRKDTFSYSYIYKFKYTFCKYGFFSSWVYKYNSKWKMYNENKIKSYYLKKGYCNISFYMIFKALKQQMKLNNIFNKENRQQSICLICNYESRAINLRDNIIYYHSNFCRRIWDHYSPILFFKYKILVKLLFYLKDHLKKYYKRIFIIKEFELNNFKKNYDLVSRCFKYKNDSKLWSIYCSKLCKNYSLFYQSEFFEDFKFISKYLKEIINVINRSYIKDYGKYKKYNRNYRHNNNRRNLKEKLKKDKKSKKDRKGKNNKKGKKENKENKKEGVNQIKDRDLYWGDRYNRDNMNFRNNNYSQQQSSYNGYSGMNYLGRNNDRYNRDNMNFRNNNYSQKQSSYNGNNGMNYLGRNKDYYNRNNMNFRNDNRIFHKNRNNHRNRIHYSNRKHHKNKRKRRKKMNTLDVINDNYNGSFYQKSLRIENMKHIRPFIPLNQLIMDNFRKNNIRVIIGNNGGFNPVIHCIDINLSRKVYDKLIEIKHIYLNKNRKQVINYEHWDYSVRNLIKKIHKNPNLTKKLFRRYIMMSFSEFNDKVKNVRIDDSYYKNIRFKKALN